MEDGPCGISLGEVTFSVEDDAVITTSSSVVARIFCSVVVESILVFVMVELIV